MASPTTSYHNGISSDQPQARSHPESIVPPLCKTLPFDENLELSNVNFDLTITQCEDIGKDLKVCPDSSAYPTTYVFAKLSNLVYQDDPKGLPDGWHLLTTASHKTSINDINGYFGATFWHPKQQKVIIAHRGTHITSAGSLYTDFKSIIQNKNGNQMSSACTFAHKIITVLRKIESEQPEVRFQLFFTGHSLGGWLAQITTFSTKYLKLCDSNFILNKISDDGYHAHTVVFESPGCKDMLTQMMDDFKERYGNFSTCLDKLDITTYLSAPNRINSCRLHLGTIFRIFPDFTDLGYVSQKTPWYNIATHKIEKILKVFEVSRDVANNLRIEKVSDWPLTGKHSEFYDFFNWVTDLIDYHVDYRNDTFKRKIRIAGNSNPVRYKTKKYEGNTVSLSIFSEVEKNVLSTWKRLQTTGLKLVVLDKLVKDKQLGITNIFFKNVTLDMEHSQFQCESKEEIANLVCQVKHMMRWFRVDVLEAIKKQLEVPDVYDSMIQAESNNNIEALTKSILDFKDTIGLQDFFKSPIKRVMCIINPKTDNDLHSARLCKILIKIPEKNSNKLLYLKWKNLVKTTNFSNIDRIFDENCRFKLIILDCLVQTDICENDKILLSKILNHYEKESKQKIVFLVSKCGNFVEKIESLKNLEATTWKENFNLMQLDDLTEKSQEMLFKKDILNFQGNNMSLSKFLKIDHSSNLNHTKIKKLTTFLNFEHFIGLISKSETVTVGKKLYTLSDLELLYKKVNKEIKAEHLVDVLLADKTNSSENSKQMFFFNIVDSKMSEKSNKVVDELISYLNISDEDKRQKVLEMVTNDIVNITCNVSHNDHLLSFRESCNNHIDKIHYCLELSNREIHLQQIYDQNFYLKRQLLHRELSTDAVTILLTRCSDILIFSTINDTQQFMNDFNISELNLPENVIILVKKTEIEELKCFQDKIKVNQHVHWFKIGNAGQEIILHKSHGSLDMLRKLIHQQQRLFLNEEIPSKKNNRAIIIADEPGMGKSTILTSMSMKMKSCWVIRIDLKECSQSLKELSSNIQKNEVVKFLLSNDTQITDDLVTRLLTCCIEDNTFKQVVVMFDGFDEIMEDPLEEEVHVKSKMNAAQKSAIQLMKYLEEETMANIWVTTRTILRDDLEVNLLVFADNFERISECEQTHFLLRYWLSSLQFEFGKINEYINKQLEDYVDKVFEKAKQFLTNDISNFMGIPLQMRMLAEVLAPPAQLVSDSGYATIELPINNVLELYQMFINKKYNLYYHDKTSLAQHLSYVNERNLKAVSFKHHQRLAFEYLFPKEAELFLKSNIEYLPKKNEMINWDDIYELNRIGLIQSKGSDFGDFEFIHRTIAEYFCAELFINWLTKPQGRHPKYPPFHEFLMTRILLEPKHSVIMLFLSNYLSKPPLSKVQSPISKKALKFIGQCITNLWKEKKEKCLNQKKQTALHVAVNQRNDGIVSLILDSIKEADTESDFLSFLALRDVKACTALNIALNKNLDNIVALILEFTNSCSDNVRQEIMAATFFEKSVSKTMLPVFSKYCNAKWIWASPQEDPDLPHINTEEELKMRNMRYLNMIQNYSNLVSIYNLVIEKSKIYELVSFITKVGEKDRVNLTTFLETHSDRHSNFRHYLMQVMYDGKSVLHIAIDILDLEVFRYLVDQGADYLLSDYTECSVFHYSVKKGCLPIVKYLVKEKGVDVNECDNLGKTALHVAARNNFPDIVTYLLQKGADVNVQTLVGHTALHESCFANNLKIVKKLVEMGVNIDDTGDDGRTPLFISAWYHRIEILKYLVQKGAKLDSRNKDGVSVLDHCITDGRLDYVKYLLDNGADYQSATPRGTPLHIAVYYKSWQVVDYFVKEKHLSLPESYDQGMDTTMLLGDLDLMKERLDAYLGELP